MSGQPACSLCIKSLSESPLPRARGAASQASPARAAARTVRVPPNRARQPLCARPRQAQLCETCPLSTGGRTRRVQLVWGEGRDVSS